MMQVRMHQQVEGKTIFLSFFVQFELSSPKKKKLTEDRQRKSEEDVEITLNNIVLPMSENRLLLSKSTIEGTTTNYTKNIMLVLCTTTLL